MEALIQKYKLDVNEIVGKEEFAIFKNYYMQEAMQLNLDKCLDDLFENNNGSTVKNQDKATHWRWLGNAAFSESTRNLKKCEYLYTRSLCYSVFDSENYALSLEKRSEVYYQMKDYKSAILDINNCLSSQYPDSLKPNIYLRKADCLRELGRGTEMRKVLVNALNIVIEWPNNDKWVEEICSKLTTDKILDDDDHDISSTLPIISENASFLNASSSVGFRYGKMTGLRVFAEKDIKRGDALFVEKAFAFSPTFREFDDVDKAFRLDVYCQYCLLLIRSGIPCKSCVRHIYCNEECRDAAWSEFHQWECAASRIGLSTMFNDVGFLALRIIFKSVWMGGQVTSFIDFNRLTKYGDETNNYNFVYNLPRNIQKMDEDCLKLYVVVAAIWVRYLLNRTTFFTHIKSLPKYSKLNQEELQNLIGGLIIRHCAQLHTNIIPAKVVAKLSQFVYNHKTIALTMCPSATIMKHSCEPNTVNYFVQDQLVVRASEDIKENEEIFRSFFTNIGGDFNFELNIMDQFGRRELLAKVCYLYSVCKACSNQQTGWKGTNGVVCHYCNGPAFRLDMCIKPEFQCSTCSRRFFKNDIDATVFAINTYFIQYELTGRLEFMLKCERLMNRHFISTHCLFVGVHKAIHKFYCDEGNVKGYFIAGRKYSEVLKTIFKGSIIDDTLFLYSLCERAVTDLKMGGNVGNMNPSECREFIRTQFVEVWYKVQELLSFYHPVHNLDFDNINKFLENDGVAQQ